MRAFDTLGDVARHYSGELRHGDRESAFHALIEAEPAIVPLLIAEFAAETDTEFRAQLLTVIAEFRLPDTVPFFAERLFDGHWKVALDFLVAQHSPEAVAALEHARSRRFATQAETDEFREWLKEAIEQATSGVK